MRLTIQGTVMAALVALSAASAAGAAGFRHPGVLVNAEQLALVRAKIAAGADPWKTAFAKMSSSNYASPQYVPHPRAVVECGSYSNPDVGCGDEKNDAEAAYTLALMWSLTGKEAYARKAADILNAWAGVLKDHTNSNAPLQSGWVSSVTTRAAEILRSSYPGWPAAEAQAYGAFLKAVYLPQIQNGSASNGNWELTMIEALFGIAVYTEDQALFDKAVSMWRKRVPAYFYLASDGPFPVRPPTGNRGSDAALIDYWYGQKRFVDGLSQETCRDFGHTQYGIAATVNAAETALQQGVDLYGPESRRLVAALEFHAGYLAGETAPDWLCGGTLHLSRGNTWEIAYNEFHNRLGLDLPKTAAYVARIRPTGADHHMLWETLTHAGVGKVGLGAIPVRPAPRAAHGALVPRLELHGNGLMVARPDARGGTGYFRLDGSSASWSPLPDRAAIGRLQGAEGAEGDF